jgi:twitching motility two-component system response regulator PilH
MATGNQILVVDDNPTVRKFITSVLQPLGYKVRSASDGMEALAEVARQAPDMILLDLVMPRMNGYHFCMALEQKRLAPMARIVLLSSAREHVAQKVQDTTRVEEALPKPVKAQQLRALVAKYLPLSEEQAAEGEIEFDMSEEEPVPGAPLEELSFGDEVTSDDTISGPLELVGLLRDKLDTAVAEGLAARLDQIMESKSREEVLGLMAEVLASVVNDKLVQRMIDLVRTTYGDESETKN